MSTLLFVEILRERGIQAQWFDARKVLRTNDRFGRAEPDIAAVAELTQQQLAPRLAEGLVVTQGFIGSEAKGRTTTLGRGGSDYTAALLGEALECHPRRYLDRCARDLYDRSARGASGETHRRHRL